MCVSVCVRALSLRRTSSIMIQHAHEQIASRMRVGFVSTQLARVYKNCLSLCLYGYVRMCVCLCVCAYAYAPATNNASVIENDARVCATRMCAHCVYVRDCVSACLRITLSARKNDATT